MSNPRLPAELLDYIVDLLHDAPRALRNCCLVSRSWIPRTRKHIFARINFWAKQDLESWKKTFPDPSTSPACYTTTLDVGCSHVVAAADAEVGGWIRGFSRVVHLGVGNRVSSDESKISLLPFHGLSPNVKSLRLYFIDLPPPRVLDLAITFPLLEDLTADSRYGPHTSDGDVSDGPLTVIQPSNPPVFTGSLKLSQGGVRRIGRQLALLTGGIHFRKISLTQFSEKDLSLVTGLVEKCAHTLESVDVSCSMGSWPGPASLDFSRLSKLTDATFRFELRNVEWITMALKTITPKSRDLRRISICVFHYCTNISSDVIETIVERNFKKWSDLDRLLVQFWESRSIRPMVVRTTPVGGRWDESDCIRSLLPEITRRGIVDVAECYPP